MKDWMIGWIILIPLSLIMGAAFYLFFTAFKMI